MYARTYWPSQKKVLKKSRKMFLRLFGVRMMSGHQALRSSAAWRVWQTKKIIVCEARLSLMAAQRRAAQRAMERKFTTSPVSAPPNLMQ